ncbi:hypothetical protein [Synechococcus sp. M16CYN]
MTFRPLNDFLVLKFYHGRLLHCHPHPYWYNCSFNDRGGLRSGSANRAYC